MTFEEISEQYRAFCTLLGDIEVRIEGLKNKRAELFKKIAILDDMAANLHKQVKNDETSIP